MEKVSQNFVPYKEAVRDKLSKSTELINTKTNEVKVLPSLQATVKYLRELNPEYKPSQGGLSRNVKTGALYKGIFKIIFVQNK
jgi:hypothetical protein